ncbi:MAG: fumarate hydratase [Deltaproteobacteria bacterium]|nr:MAG: fumarate hydratase [Deltaproteobacteria bacterium]RLB77521.1 MAG: fumarate hydratase [Deltaproteobacteria bacterium]
MRKIPVKKIIEAVKQEAIAANLELGEDMIQALRRASQLEESDIGKDILDRLLENAELARANGIPICQDTGVAVIFAELGQEVHIVGGDFVRALEEGIRRGYKEGYLRKSICHPFTRKNTGDNTPIIVHLDIVPGDQLRLWVVPKGGGSENMSALYMLPPSAGWDGIKERVLDTVVKAGPNPCPPIVVGLGIGGNFEQCALLAKKALLRPVLEPNPDPELRAMEEELLEEINKSGIGPQGLGGRVTCLAVQIKMMPCHIASLPVAINIQCHANRHREIVL